MAVAHAQTNGVTRLRPGRQFFITISFGYKDPLLKEDVFSVIDSIEYTSYCISLESSSDNSKVSCHVHVFLELVDKYFIDDVRQFFASVFDECGLNVQSCKSKRSCVKYITKEDVEPVTNIKLSDLHFNVRVHNWCKKALKFDCTDPFVVEHRFCYRYLNRYYNDYQKKKYPVFKGFSKCQDVKGDWAVVVCSWWNDAIEGFTVKRKCLYLHGPTNVGKTTLIESLICRRNLPFVFLPGVGKFFMQGFDSTFHKLILFEEFEIKYHVVAMLKRLLEGRKYAYPVKCEQDMIIEFKGPIIFVSNLNDIADAPLMTRLLFVSAQTPYYTQETFAIPKKEVVAVEEVHEILSSSEEFV